jgi:hypothetical protein
MGPLTSSRFDFELKFADIFEFEARLAAVFYSSKSKQNFKLGEFLTLNLLGIRKYSLSIGCFLFGYPFKGKGIN